MHARLQPCRHGAEDAASISRPHRARPPCCSAAAPQHDDYVTAVLDAATNPGLADSEAERRRERLDQAGLLADPGRRHNRPEREETAGARRRAGVRTELSQLISEDR